MQASSWLTLAALLLGGCAAPRGLGRPTFSYNHHLRNALIVNRRPQYGNGQPDGCVVELQFALALRSMNGDSLAGVVMDTKTREPVFYATARLFYSNDSEPVTIPLSAAGSFIFRPTNRAQRIAISAVGYRTLTVNLQPIGN